MEKIYFNKIEEDNCIKISSGCQITNLSIDFNLIFEEGQIENFYETIPELIIIPNMIFFPGNDTVIANTTLNTIMHHIFYLILEKY